MDDEPIDILRKQIKSVNFFAISQFGYNIDSKNRDVCSINGKKLLNHQWQTNSYIQLIHIITQCTGLIHDICDIILDMTAQKWDTISHYYQDILVGLKPAEGSLHPHFNPTLLRIFTNEMHYHLIPPRIDKNTYIVLDSDIKNNCENTIKIWENFISQKIPNYSSLRSTFVKFANSFVEDNKNCLIITHQVGQQDLPYLKIIQNKYIKGCIVNEYDKFIPARLWMIMIGTNRKFNDHVTIATIRITKESKK